MTELTNGISKITGPVINICRMLIGVLLALLILATIAGLAGFDIPFLKELSTANATGTAALIAAIAFYLKG